ncbi:MAG TPA: tetratricopeptide repeat protein, partial [Pirellulales bacterium]
MRRITAVPAGLMLLASIWSAPVWLMAIWLPAIVGVQAIVPEAVCAQSQEDPVESLTPVQQRSESDEDRLAAAAHYATGRALEQRDHYDLALREYERALRYDPHATPVLHDLIPLAFRSSHNEVGLRYLVKFAEQHPVETPLLLEAAQYLKESGDWEGALKLYAQVEQSLAKQPPSAKQVAIAMEMGRLYFLTEHYAEAAARLKQVQEALAKPKDFGLDDTALKLLEGEKGATYELLGAVFVEAKQPDAARKAFEEANRAQPDEGALQLNLAAVDLAADKPQAALDKLDAYCQSHSTPTSIASYELLGQALKSLRQENDLISRLEKLHAAQPKNMLLAYFLGQQYREGKQFDRALPLLEAAHAEKPTVQTYQALWNVYLHTKQYDKLLGLLGEVVEKTGALSPLETEIKLLLKDDSQTADFFTAAKQLSADSAHAAMLRSAALVAADAKRWPEAETLFNRAIEANPKATAELFTSWGLGLLLDEKAEEAAKVLKRGIDSKPSAKERPALNFYLASALEMQGKTDEALAAAKAAIEEDPKNLNFAARPAWVLYHAKRRDAAAKAYQELIDKYDDDFDTEGAREIVKEARSALSNLNVLKRDIPPAVEFLEQILDEFPDDAAKAYQAFIDQFDSDYSSPDVRDSLREARTALSNIAEQRHNVPQ